MSRGTTSFIPVYYRSWKRDEDRDAFRGDKDRMGSRCSFWKKEEEESPVVIKIYSCLILFDKVTGHSEAQQSTSPLVGVVTKNKRRRHERSNHRRWVSVDKFNFDEI